MANCWWVGLKSHQDEDTPGRNKKGTKDHMSVNYKLPTVPSSLANASTSAYRGRIAPTPSGHLHKGHASTFFIAYKRSQQIFSSQQVEKIAAEGGEEENKGSLVLRIEVIDC